MSFGDMLQQLRVDREVSLRDLAKKVGVSAIYLSDIERGHRRPPAQPVIERIASALEIAAPTLLRAAHIERDAFELRFPKDAARQEAALALMRVWEQLDDKTAEQLKMLLEDSERK